MTGGSAEVPVARREWQYKCKKFGVNWDGQYVQWDGRVTAAADRVLEMQSQAAVAAAAGMTVETNIWYGLDVLCALANQLEPTVLDKELEEFARVRWNVEGHDAAGWDHYSGNEAGDENRHGS